MKTLNDFKRNIHAYYYNNVAHKAGTDPNEDWDSYWDMIYDTLVKRNLLVIRNGQKFVKEVLR